MHGLPRWGCGSAAAATHGSSRHSWMGTGTACARRHREWARPCDRRAAARAGPFPGAPLRVRRPMSTHRRHCGAQMGSNPVRIGTARTLDSYARWQRQARHIDPPRRPARSGYAVSFWRHRTDASSAVSPGAGAWTVDGTMSGGGGPARRRRGRLPPRAASEPAMIVTLVNVSAGGALFESGCAPAGARGATSNWDALQTAWLASRHGSSAALSLASKPRGSATARRCGFT